MEVGEEVGVVAMRRGSRGGLEQGQRSLSVLTVALKQAAENALVAHASNLNLNPLRDTHAVLSTTSSSSTTSTSSSSSSSSTSSLPPPLDMMTDADIHQQHCSKFHHTVLTSIYHDNIRLGVAYMPTEVTTPTNPPHQYTPSTHPINTPY